MKEVTGQLLENVEDLESKESLYRTKWLIAHNQLHEIVHSKASISLADAWADYLKKLESSEAAAKIPA